ncbi:MAG TPA: helix-hairpin-helix domain-containing protein [Candidatus Ozemobacteraceae bacterium]|nr:helix-hairpin-helix domain-containing protein [Candidatus Ozemobacteraceae bacterium]
MPLSVFGSRLRVGLLLVLVLVPLMPALSWSGNTHRKIAADALSLMPSEFQERFGSYKKTLMNGAVDPDRLIKDFQNHVYHVHTTRPDVWQVAPDRLQELFQTITDLLHGKERLPVSGKALKAYLKRSTTELSRDEEIAYQLGLLSHYVADLNQPLHTDGADIDPVENEYHDLFERDVENQLSQISLLPIRANPVSDLRQRTAEMAKEANSGYRAIGEAYRQGNRAYDLTDLLQKQYSASVQQVIDFWLGVFAFASSPLSTALTRAPDLSVNTISIGHSSSQTRVYRARINLNTASQQELESLPEVGPKKARAIMAARPFRSVYDLRRVKGFGQNLVDKLIDQVTIDP